MSRKQKKTKKQLPELLKSIYYSLGKSGAFYSAEKLRAVLLKEKKVKANIEDIQKWLEEELAYSLHRNRRKTFSRNPIIASGIDDNWQADIGFLTKFKKFNKGFSCFLVVIDVLSKYAWVEAMKSKDGPSTARAFEIILSRAHPRVPEKLQTDKGKEFYNRNFESLMKKFAINLYSTESDMKAAVAERFVKTLKMLILRYMSTQQTNDWVSKLQDFVATYNKTIHKTIKMTPSEASKIENEGKVIRNVYGFLWASDNLKKTKTKFKVGDFVRVSKSDKIFRKGYEGHWSEEIFKIVRIQKRKPSIMYELADLKGEKLIGLFYESELGRVRMKEKTYWRVEKILKKKFIKGKLHYLVKFLNYQDPEWILASNVANVKDVKTLLK